MDAIHTYLRNRLEAQLSNPRFGLNTWAMEYIQAHPDEFAERVQHRVRFVMGESWARAPTPPVLHFHRPVVPDDPLQASLKTMNGLLGKLNPTNPGPIISQFVVEVTQWLENEDALRKIADMIYELSKRSDTWNGVLVQLIREAGIPPSAFAHQVEQVFSLLDKEFPFISTTAHERIRDPTARLAAKKAQDDALEVQFKERRYRSKSALWLLPLFNLGVVTDLAEPITKMVEDVLAMDNRPELHEDAGNLAKCLCDLASTTGGPKALIRSTVASALADAFIDAREMSSTAASHHFRKILGQ